MNKKLLEKIIIDTEKDPIIKWNNKSLLSIIDNDVTFSSYIYNKENISGYFALLHNLVSNLPDDAVIVELGNREGLGIISMYDALKENQTLYTLDIVDDVRFVIDEIKDDKRVHIMNDFNSLNEGRVGEVFETKSIDLIFFDTIHTYDQVSSEYRVWQQYLKDDCVLLIDDIRDIQDDRTKWKFHEELEMNKYDLTDWAHARTGFGVYLK